MLKVNNKDTIVKSEHVNADWEIDKQCQSNSEKLTRNEQWVKSNE